MQAVDFECTEVVLDLPFPDPKIVDGWKIQLLTCPKVLVSSTLIIYHYPLKIYISLPKLM